MFVATDYRKFLPRGNAHVKFFIARAPSYFGLLIFSSLPNATIVEKPDNAGQTAAPGLKMEDAILAEAATAASLLCTILSIAVTWRWCLRMTAVGGTDAPAEDIHLAAVDGVDAVHLAVDPPLPIHLAAVDGPDAPAEVHLVDPPLPLPVPVEPTTQQVEPITARPDWLRWSTGRLVAWVAAHRGIDSDWRHMHDAAKAGRVEVVSQLCHGLRISVLLKNKRGRNILHAAISHKRNVFVCWLAGGHASQAFPKPPAYECVMALFTEPDAAGQKPFLAAATRQDATIVHAMTHVLGQEFRRLGPPSTDRAEFLEVMAFFEAGSSMHISLLGQLRAYDVSLAHSGCYTGYTPDAIVSTFESSAWWPPNLELQPWRSDEARHLYCYLQMAVSRRQPSLVAWFLDVLRVSPSPPSGMLWQGWHLGDYALVRRVADEDELERTEPERDARAVECEWARKGRATFLRDRDCVMDKWDGLSSASLAEQVDAYLGTMRTIEETLGSRLCPSVRHAELQHAALIAWSCQVTGEPPKGVETADADCEGVVGADAGRRAETLQLLTDRLGVKGSPRLQTIATTGSAWALRWLLQSGLVALETPLGGEERLPSIEEGGDNCSICLEAKLSPVVLPCGHDVCRACVQQWFRHTEGTARCPLCRQDVPAPEDVMPQDLTFALADDLALHAPWLPGERPPSSWSASSATLGHVLAALAAYRGALAVLELLRDEGLDLALTFEGTNLMHIAAMNAQPHIVRWLVGAGHAELALALSHEGKRPIHYACESGDDSTLSLLRHLVAHMERREASALEAAQDEINLIRSCIQQARSADVDGAELAGTVAHFSAHLKVAESSAEAARTALEAARARLAPLAAAAEGWVEAALASPSERVSGEATRYQEASAAEEALSATFPRLLAERAALAAFLELEPDLKRSRIGSAAHWCSPPRESNPWLQVMRQVADHGRADVMRWIYSRRWLSHTFAYNARIDPDVHGVQTYEDFGRELAARCRNEAAGRALVHLYDDLRASDAALKAWLEAKSELKELFGFSQERFHCVQAPGSPEPAVDDILAAVARINAAVASFPADLRPDSVYSGDALLDDDPSSYVEGRRPSDVYFSEFTCRNFVATRGYLTIVRWFVEDRGSTIEQVLRMLFLAVRHTPYAQRSPTADTLVYLTRWLLAQGADVEGARFRRFDHNDTERRGDNLEQDPRSLLDMAVDNATVLVPLYWGEEEEAVDACLARCWECVELLQAHLRGWRLSRAGFEGCLKDISRGFRFRSAVSRSAMEDIVLRFLRLAEGSGIDLSGTIDGAYDGEPACVAQILVNGGLIGCVRWLAEEREVDVQHLVACRSCFAGAHEERGVVEQALLRLQRAQRQRHVAARAATLG